jgi:hypothetical protein
VPGQLPDRFFRRDLAARAGLPNGEYLLKTLQVLWLELSRRTGAGEAKPGKTSVPQSPRIRFAFDQNQGFTAFTRGLKAVHSVRCQRDASRLQEAPITVE